MYIMIYHDLVMGKKTKGIMVYKTLAFAELVAEAMNTTVIPGVEDYGNFYTVEEYKPLEV
jgi:hypothetical protein